MIIFALVIGTVLGGIAGKLLGPRRQRGWLPYLFAGAIGASVGSFITRAVFIQDAYNIGEWIALAGAAVGAALFIALAHLLPVRQTLRH